VSFGAPKDSVPDDDEPTVKGLPPGYVVPTREEVEASLPPEPCEECGEWCWWRLPGAKTWTCGLCTPPRKHQAPFEVLWVIDE